MKSGYEGLRLRIFVHEAVTHGDRPLYQYLVERARIEGLAGATVLQGIEGYGEHKHLHTSRFLDASDDMPMIVEFVDRPEAIQRFVDALDGILGEGMATLSPVEIVKYSAGSPQ